MYCLASTEISTLASFVRARALDQARSAVRDCMTGAAALRVPLEVQIGTGANWDEAH